MSSEAEELAEDEYVVEKIMDRKWDAATKKYLYFIRWAGFNSDWDTWEPEENLDCEDILKAFNEKWDKKANKASSAAAASASSSTPKTKASSSSSASNAGKAGIRLPLGQNVLNAAFSGPPGKKAKTSSTAVSSTTKSKTTMPAPSTSTTPATKSAKPVKKADSRTRASSPPPPPRHPRRVSNEEEEDDDDGPHGFERGLEAEAVLGATRETGELLFLVKWKESDESDLVAAEEVKKKIPQLVIEFYQDRIRWHDHEENSGDKNGKKKTHGSSKTKENGEVAK